MRRVVLVLLLLAVTAWGLFDALDRRWREPLSLPPSGYQLVVERGDSLRTVVSKLHEDGYLHYPGLVQAYGRLTGVDQRIRRGEYQLQPGLTPLGLLQLLQRGKVISYQVTLPEGITLATAIKRLAQHPVLDATLTGTDDKRLLDLTGGAPEGLFFPDSYHFERGANDWDILARAYQRMQAVLAEEWPARAADLPYETPYEALIMASIVERETGLAEERDQIAGVFVRRLQRRMRLQTDPTVIYGLGPDFDGNLTRAHLNDEANPYNSYRHHGLPPTPIALPGRAAIHAALHPAAGEALYFVARGDGSHEFNASLEAHERAVRKYQLQRRADYRSSPGEGQ